ncbi:hypothetical protein GA0115243_1062155 [Streptomyces sp. ScaeMP-e83]|nr:hypothetical protein GA0115243_1062155 [Streptomyces sp. ScaeMP-e83]
MDPDVGTGPLEGAGQAGVVGVAVGQQYGADVGQGAVGACQVFAQSAGVGRESRVDEDQAVGLLDQETGALPRAPTPPAWRTPAGP